MEECAVVVNIGIPLVKVFFLALRNVLSRFLQVMIMRVLAFAPGAERFPDGPLSHILPPIPEQDRRFGINFRVHQLSFTDITTEKLLLVSLNRFSRLSKDNY